MSRCRIALANIAEGTSAGDSLDRAVAAIAAAGRSGADMVCFPECYVPGYRWPDRPAPPVDEGFLTRAWAAIAEAARQAAITVVLGTERVTGRGLQITAGVFAPDGSVPGWQDKCQLDPDEEPVYPAFGGGRQVFRAGDLTFGIVICHEGWRYPETVRWAVRAGAQVVFHPFAHPAEPERRLPAGYADPANSFHEKAVLCRAAENGCYFASVVAPGEGVAATSAIAGPDGALLAWQPYGVEGLLVADLDLTLATRRLAERLRPEALRGI